MADWRGDDLEAWRAAYRRIFKTFFRPREEIAEEADRFWQNHLGGRPTLAVHLRGADKAAEDAAAADLGKAYIDEIDRRVDEHPNLALFLLTDSRRAAADWQTRYGDRMVSAPATRTGSDMGVHFQPHPDRHLLGREVLRDVLVATKCDSFVGTGFSNVSHAVACLTD